MTDGTEQAEETPRRGLSRWPVRAVFLAALLLAWLARGGTAAAVEIPAYLPRYDLDVDLRVDEQRVVVRERVTWTNPSRTPTAHVVFNVASHYAVPDKDVGLLAKMLELLRLAPSQALDFGGPACEVQAVTLCPAAPTATGTALPFAWREDNLTVLEVYLPGPVGPGESVTLDLAFTLRLPQKQGRWGQWGGVTFLAQWLPVTAYYDDTGWQPPPFIPWHQPFFNEAGVYTARVTLPADQKLGSTGSVAAETDLGDGRRRVAIGPVCARDFALFCSARFQEFRGHAGGVHVRCLAFPEHAFYARVILDAVCEALPVYSSWFGPFPYPEFTVVESYFGWNGNECGGVVMIDQRMFAMPHLARDYVTYLVSHELCHQWWYNVVGTNGYAETWMDEGLATYFSHRLIDSRFGKNNTLLRWPTALGWLPNIRREDYRHYGMLGTMGRGEATATVQEMPAFLHLGNLNSMAYDRGSRIVGMIEARLGADAMLDFMRRVYGKYAFRILRVADFQRELEAYTGHSWEEFFRDWLYRPGMVDWCLEDVRLEQWSDGDGWARRISRPRLALLSKPHASGPGDRPWKVTAVLRQKGECREPTVLGIRYEKGPAYQLRVPIAAGGPGVQIDDGAVRVETCTDGAVRVEVVVPHRPRQLTIDPDQVLLDRNPTNNSWRPAARLRFTPLYTSLEETDLTNAYDRWNVIVGPWLYGAAYHDPWYMRSTMAGVRAALYRTQEFTTGAYLAYRTDDRNIVAGVDGLRDHWPFPRTQVGYNVEHSLTTLSPGYQPCSRAVLFGRYIFTYGSSLYLPPFKYAEVFGTVQDRCLPFPETPTPGAERFDRQALAGFHYHQYYLTPYWDPEGGVALDVTYQAGFPVFGIREGSHQAFGQVATVKGWPGWLGFVRDLPGLGWVGSTRFAFRLYGAAAVPGRGQFFTLGGGDQFRGFDLRERQGSMAWIASAEWRIPLLTGLEWDVCDHVAGVRNVYTALFYDAGDMFVSGRSLGSVAHALGVGLRVDVAWFGLIERTMLRLDVAKTVNASTPWQIWIGIQHPF